MTLFTLMGLLYRFRILYAQMGGLHGHNIAFRCI